MRSLILCLTVAAPVAHATEAVPAPEEVLTDTSDDRCAAVDLSGGMAETMSTVPGSRWCLVSKAEDQVGNTYITATGACSVCRYDPNITINKQPGLVTESQTPWKPEE